MRALMQLPAPHVADRALCHFLRDTRGHRASTTLRVPASFYGTLTVTHRGAILDGRSGRALPRVALGGPRTVPGELHFEPGTVATTVVMKPGGANRLAVPGLPLSADEATDGGRLVRLEPLLSTLDDAASSNPHADAVARIEALLAEPHAPEQARFDDTLRPLLWRLPTMPVSELGREFGCTPRNLQRLFMRELGVAPKLFCRLARLHGIFWHVHGLGRDARPHWAELAGACGFSDQAHLHRELRALTGLTPLGFLRALRQGPGAVWALRVPAETLGWCHRPALRRAA